ncbi:LOW QUALITY PROTEIN: monocarboxylate transporter 12-like [Haliotis rubra]|uniref:LOW QUALITY PROTEIN: monocarboxylate transporter 12-like n=1 Tax=Haliotis rubra TaxID=36100 RepID=UPI001EE62F65|nr:LOW QUALITY PROTEIN: monocarboxylate transporter 12-like [Haliotis rubra]
MISVLVDGVCFSQGIFFNVFMNHFNSNKATTSWIGSVLNGSYLTIGPFVSMLVNKFGCRQIAITGAVVSSVALFVSTFSPNIALLTFLYGFMGGIGFGLMYLPAIVMVGYYFDKRRALATGIACCGSGIGTFVFAPLSEFLLGEYNWQGTTWIMSGLVLNGAIFSMFYRPLPAATCDHSDNSDMQLAELGDNKPIYSKNRKDSEPIVRCRSYDMNLNKPVNGQISMIKGDNDIARLAHSHGAIPQDRRHGHKQSYLQPLERKDIFYSGSIRNLKEFSQAGSEREYTRSMFTSRQSLQPANGDKVVESLPLCTRAVRGLLSVFDISLLKSPTFLLYGISCFLCMMGFFVPFTYIPPLALDMDISLKDAAFLISIIGITNTVGRVVVGFVSDQSWADCLLINNIALIIAGVATILVPFYGSYGLLSAYVAIFGLGIAVFVSLRSIIMVELMGLEKLTSAFGLVIMFQGMSSYIGAPIAGAIADTFGSYNAAFYVSGSTLAMAGVICLPLRKLAAWEKAREHKHRAAESQAMLDSP